MSVPQLKTVNDFDEMTLFFGQPKVIPTPHLASVQTKVGIITLLLYLPWVKQHK